MHQEWSMLRRMHQEWSMYDFGHGEKPIFCTHVGREGPVGSVATRFDDTQMESPSSGIVFIDDRYDTVSFFWQWPEGYDVPQPGYHVVMRMSFEELPDGGPPSGQYAKFEFVLTEFVRFPFWYGGHGFKRSDLGLRAGVHRVFFERVVDDIRDTLASDFLVQGFRLCFEQEALKGQTR